jgi:hypothetical protein
MQHAERMGELEDVAERLEVAVAAAALASLMCGAPLTGPKLTTFSPTCRWRSALRACSTKLAGAWPDCASTSSRPRRTELRLIVDECAGAPVNLARRRAADLESRPPASMR